MPNGSDHKGDYPYHQGSGKGVMKIYLAARISRAEEMRKCRDDLVKLGHTVTSRWIDGNHSAENNETEKLTQFAIDDWYDILAADTVICFTEEPRKPSTNRGGRHVEFGIALALSEDVYVIGWRENAFHFLPQVRFYEKWSDLRDEMSYENTKIR